MSLKLVSVNVNLSGFLDRVVPFLQTEQPDVVCMQECDSTDIPRIEEVLGARSVFSPRFTFMREGVEHGDGVALFSRFPMNARAEYYAGEHDPAPFFKDGLPGPEFEHETRKGRSLVSADIEKDGVVYAIATTHFTWTPQGLPDESQRRDVVALLALLAEKKEFVFCGDLNMPRGGEMFSEIAKHYKDNIPAEYVWSLDTALHRAGHERLSSNAQKLGMQGYMVDGLFTTSTYAASDVRLVSGVSDHCAVVATITKLT